MSYGGIPISEVKELRDRLLAISAATRQIDCLFRNLLNMVEKLLAEVEESLE